MERTGRVVMWGRLSRRGQDVLTQVREAEWRGEMGAKASRSKVNSQANAGWQGETGWLNGQTVQLMSAKYAVTATTGVVVDAQDPKKISGGRTRKRCMNHGGTVADG